LTDEFLPTKDTKGAEREIENVRFQFLFENFVFFVASFSCGFNTVGFDTNRAGEAPFSDRLREATGAERLNS